MCVSQLHLNNAVDGRRDSTELTSFARTSKPSSPEALSRAATFPSPPSESRGRRNKDPQVDGRVELFPPKLQAPKETLSSQPIPSSFDSNIIGGADPRSGSRSLSSKCAEAELLAGPPRSTRFSTAEENHVTFQVLLAVEIMSLPPK